MEIQNSAWPNSFEPKSIQLDIDQIGTEPSDVAHSRSREDIPSKVNVDTGPHI